MARAVKGGLIQASAALDGEAMIEKHLPIIEEAANRGVQILCLQEVFTRPYFAAEQDNRWIEIAESIPEHEMSGFIYNTAAVIDAEHRDGAAQADVLGAAASATAGEETA